MLRSLLLLLAILTPLAGLHAAFPQDKSDLPAEETITWGILDNGVRYAVMPNKEPPGRVSVRLLVEAGSLMETDAQAGLAHFLEHMAFNGSTHFPPGELVEYLQRIGMSFGADTNAHTSFDETVYKLELPGNNEAMLREGLQVMRDYAGGLLLGEEEVDKERGVILAEKRARDSAQWRTTEAWFDFVFPESLISQRLPIGTEEVIKTAPRDRFVEFYQTWYSADRIAVVLVGEITPEDAVPLIEEYFSSLSKNENPLPEPDLGKLTQPELATKLHSEPELPTTTISIMSLKADSGATDSKAERQRALTISLANRIITRRLEILAEQEGAPFSKGYASWFDFLDFVEAAEIQVDCKPENWQASLELIEQQLRKALQYGFTESELEEAKANILEGYRQAAREASTRQSRALSGGIANSLSEDMVFTSPATDLALAEETLDGLDTQKILAALQAIWSAPSRFVFVSGNLVLEDGDTKIAEAFQASAEVEVTPPEEAETPDFAYTSFGEPGKIASETVHEDLGITQAVFENKVRLNFKQTDFIKDRVLINVSFGGGELSEPESREGIGHFADATFVRGGLEAHSYNELQRILAGTTVSVGFAVGSDAFQLFNTFSSKDMVLQAQLIAAYLTAPGYRPEAARLARQDFEEMYIQLQHTAEGVLRDKVYRFISGGSYRFGFPPEEVLLGRSSDEVKAWLAEPLKDAYLEVSIVGDIDYATARDAIAQTLGALPARADAPEAYTDARESVKFPTEAKREEYPFESDIPRAMGVVLWPTNDFWDITRTRTLNLLASIFRDRLRVEVREKLGDGYSPYALSRPSETYTGFGYIMALNFCDPAKTQQVADIIANIGRDLGTGSITEDERERALMPLVNSIQVSLRENGYWLDRVMVGSSIRPELLGFARTLPTAYPDITLEDLNHAAKTYFAGEDSGLEVIISPTAKAEASQ